ncbi:MAG TPA: putative LPS assembly protein LptD [Vicinamibacterales bacterium]|nr:putative LPS assembly protein LptD [Vicinamibacterales bacterium]
MTLSAHVRFLCLLLCLGSTPAAAQVIEDWDCKQFTLEKIDADRVRLMREVECNGSGANAGQQIFADELIWNLTTGELEASGNVLVVTPSARLAAERVVFNTKTGLGTFYTASGSASLGDRAAEVKSMFGTLEPDVYFFGEIIEKIGDSRYRLTKGSFTTCVQPTPRWDVVSGTATIQLEDYAILRNAVLRVKDVPILYLPVMYYPIQSDDRATGFLLPTYGSSTYRGQSVSNAFFWAINRSQDATLMHDWFLSRGQGAGAEYRYAASPVSSGSVNAYWLNERTPPEFVSGAGTEAQRSYELRGSLVQNLGGGLTMRGAVDYFSNLTTKQLYNNNVFDSTGGRRSVNLGVTRSWSRLSVNGIYSRSEAFYSSTFSSIYGSAPGLTSSISSQQIGRLPVFVGGNADFNRTISITRAYSGDQTVDNDASLDSLDGRATVRSPFVTLPYFTSTASLTYRWTRYSHSVVDGVHTPEPIARRYAEMGVEAFGPTVTRVFSPNNAIADRLKHVIEPYVGMQRTTSIDNANRIATTAGSVIVGDTTRITYGLDNRVLVRKIPTDATAVPTAPRDLLSVSLRQTYYSNPTASVFDSQYGLTYFYRPASSFSPIAVAVRASPVTGSTVAFNMEYDPTDLTGKLQGFSLSGGVQSATVQASGGWGRRKFATGTTGLSADNYLQASSTVSSPTQRFIVTGALNYDIGRKNLMQYRWIGAYNAQCCGIAVEYQEHNFPTSDPRFLIPKDRRFNLSFTLAGIGTFSNFLGNFGGGQR